MGDDFTQIPISGVPWLTTARLYDETWDHITTHHPEFEPSQRAKLEDAVANPTTIHESNTNPDASVVIVSENFTFSGHSVVVPIKQVDGTSGRVQTAYFSDSYSGTIIWDASNE